MQAKEVVGLALPDLSMELMSPSPILNIVCFVSILFSLEADIRTAKISQLSTQLRRQLHQLRRTLRSRRNRYKDLLMSGSVLVKAVHSNSSACVDSLLENCKKSRKTR